MLPSPMKQYELAAEISSSPKFVSVIYYFHACCLNKISAMRLSQAYERDNRQLKLLLGITPPETFMSIVQLTGSVFMLNSQFPGDSFIVAAPCRCGMLISATPVSSSAIPLTLGEEQAAILLSGTKERILFENSADQQFDDENMVEEGCRHCLRCYTKDTMFITEYAFYDRCVKLRIIMYTLGDLVFLGV